MTCLSHPDSVYVSRALVPAATAEEQGMHLHTGKVPDVPSSITATVHAMHGCAVPWGMCHVISRSTWVATSIQPDCGPANSKSEWTKHTGHQARNQPHSLAASDGPYTHASYMQRRMASLRRIVLHTPSLLPCPHGKQMQYMKVAQPQ